MVNFLIEYQIRIMNSDGYYDGSVPVYNGNVVANRTFFIFSKIDLLNRMSN